MTLCCKTCLLILALCIVPGFAQETARDNGIRLYREGKFSEARPLLEAATSRDKKDKQAWLFLGGALFKLGDLAAAVKAFQKSHADYKTEFPNDDRHMRILVTPRLKLGDRNYAMVSGRVRIAIEYGADGKIGFALPFDSSLSSQYVNAVLDVVNGIQFEPAMKEGKTVAVIRITDYEFSYSIL